MAWVAVVFYGFLCFLKAVCFHGGELAAGDALRWLHHPLEVLTTLWRALISSGAAAQPGSDAAREDAFNCAPVESFGRHAKLLESPQKV